MYCWSRIKKYNLLYFSSLLSKQSGHTSLPDVNECLFIHPYPNVCTLFIQIVQLFPLEILDFFNEFLKSGIKWNEPYYRTRKWDLLIQMTV